MNQFASRVLKCEVLLIPVLWMAPGLYGQKPGALSLPASYTFPDAYQRFRAYIGSPLSPGALLFSSITSAIAQNRNDPPEWRQAVEGYARRFGSAMAAGFMGSTAVYGLGEALHQDTAYHKCACSGVLRRMGHALRESYVARTATGRSVLSIPALAGPYAGGVAGAYAWYPDRFGWKDGIRIGTRGAISRPLQSLMPEFLP